MSNLPNSMYAWDVGNDVLDSDTVWHGINDFTCKAFEVSRKQAPNTLLFYNDNNHESVIGEMAEKSDKVFEFVKSNKHCGIDGVGF